MLEKIESRNIDYKELGQIIRCLRKLNGFTQEEVADKLNISVSALKHYELGRRKPSTECLLNMVSLFGLNSVEELLDYIRGNKENKNNE